MGDALLADSAEVQFAADATLARGNCRAEAGELSVLSQLDVQLADLRRHLLGSLEHAEIERRKAQPGDRSLRRFPDRRQTA
jgi:flagellar biosynthesis/type III secretory pathway protein FliH